MIARNRTQPSASIVRAGFGLLVCSLIATGTAVAQADAPELTVAKKVEVKYTDLNLAQHEGAVALYSRIESAARRVCAPQGKVSLRETLAARACVHDAISRAVKEVNSSQLAEVEAEHRAKLG